MHPYEITLLSLLALLHIAMFLMLVVLGVRWLFRQAMRNGAHTDSAKSLTVENELC